MSTRKIGLLLTVPLIIFLFVIMNTEAAMANTTSIDTDASDGCTGAATFPMLYVGGKDGIVFAQAAYEFDDQCQPVLVEEIRLDYVPDSVNNPEQKPFKTETIPVIPPTRPIEQGDGVTSVDTCHLRTW